MRFLVRCRYIANAGNAAGIGYLDAMGRCARDVRDAQAFETEADAWTFAANSGEDIPGDCWAEVAP